MYLRNYVSGKFSMTCDEYYIKKKKEKRKTRKTKERIIPRIQAQALNEQLVTFSEIENQKMAEGITRLRLITGTFELPIT